MTTGPALSSGTVSGGRDGERLHKVVKAIATPVYRACWRMRVEGGANVPDEGGAIVAANHVSFFDSVVLLQEIRRRAYFIGKAEYLDSWTTKHLFPAMGLIPIQREQARKAMAALEVAADVLRRGDVLGIYPEGRDPRRPAAPRPHGCRPAGAAHRGPDHPRRDHRHRRHPAHRGPGPAPVPPARRCASARRSTPPTTAVRRVVAANS